MFRALTTDLSLDDALDLDEIDNVSRSWRDAKLQDTKTTARRGRRGMAR